ncbi:unnamed protein product [Rhodiola kirilowii]
MRSRTRAPIQASARPSERMSDRLCERPKPKSSPARLFPLLPWRLFEAVLKHSRSP